MATKNKRITVAQQRALKDIRDDGYPHSRQWRELVRTLTNRGLIERGEARWTLTEAGAAACGGAL